MLPRPAGEKVALERLMLKQLLTNSERVTNDRLKTLTEEFGAHAFVKTRLADVFPIDRSGISPENYRFALQSHFDFLVTDQDLNPLFAIEFDGNTHQSEVQRRRDSQKDYLCEKFGLPILRINSRYLDAKYRGLDLLAWFISYWFVARMINDWQEQGSLPADEPFDPTDFMTMPGNPRAFPLFLSATARVNIEEMAKRYPEQDPIPSCVVIEDEQLNLRALAWLSIDRESGICVRTGMRRQRFPAVISQLLEDIAVLDLFAKLEIVRIGGERPLPMEELDTAIKRFTAGHEPLCMSVYGRGSSPGAF
jgi:hypothetical protein